MTILILIDSVRPRMEQSDINLLQVQKDLQSLGMNDGANGAERENEVSSTYN
jgi:hypothetical protein